MYELIIKIINDIDVRKYRISELQQMREILEQFKEAALEVESHRIKESGENEIKDSRRM